MQVPNGFIVAVDTENSDIVANANRGNGGNINIVTQGIFGLEPRSERSPLSDITASSNFGIDGTIIIETPDVEPERGTAVLPSGLVDASQLVAQVCPRNQVAQTELGSFVVTGRGGVPSSYSGVLDSSTLLTEWVTPSDVEPSATATLPDSSPQAVIPVEAEHWTVTDDGAIALVALTPGSPSSVNPGTASRPCL